MPELLQQEDIKEIHRLRSLFPAELEVKVRRSEDGGFFAAISTFPGLFTEAETFSELIEMVNDAVTTYFEIPRKYTSYLPSYIPPLSVAQEFGVFPFLLGERSIRLPLATKS